ncbi:cellulase family glycosylhydrolase [Glycomyces tritici]|uniref:cellulase n=1 Tax=Glycomyces tritici TaxID=2665176 RepID=A0ABT7YNU8_9ACTN|nr:cellulase family glycosylhydrolase [Glycomyces tritici]MDN3240305.1 cellulase family glycosylhydrolase [Glycomyces tritici]
MKTSDAVHRRRLRLGAIAAVAVTALTAGLIGASGAQAAQGCEVDYQVTGQWSGGFNANVEVTNLGDPVNHWDLEWTWADGQRITHMWNAKDKSKAASAKASSLGHNASLATGGSTSFGFSGSWSGANTDPTEFRLNGRLCDGSVSEPLTAMQQVAAMQPGWNIGNTLDALGGETGWGNPLITEELIQTVKAEGYKSIRLPVTWDENLGPAPDYTIDPVWLDRVAEVADMALANDMQVLLNIHHDSWMWMSAMPTDHDGVLAKYEAIWTQIAERFKDYPSELSFESVNEPQFTGTDAPAGDVLVDELNVAFHEIVRGSGGNNGDRLLVMPTLVTSADQPQLDALKATIDSLDDPMIAATVHMYGPWPFSVNIAGGTTYSEQVEQEITTTFERVHDTFVADGIPVIIGEWGVLGYDWTRPIVPSQQYGELLKFFEGMMFQARDKQMTLMLWDAGSYLNRETLEWRDPYVHSYLDSGLTTRSGTASFDSIYVEKAGAIADESLTLNRNGLEFEGLWHGDTELAEGADYTVTGDTLTFTAAALTRLAGDRAYGVNATVEARFSDGLPWRIHVISYDTPELSDASGAVNAFAIPTEFNGDRIATMEAKYADGTYAGPHDWTSYKEFWATYRPDYGGGTITLTADFFNAVRDGEPVTLTFHFWGGGTVEYTVAKSGTTVTGTAS